MKRLFIAGALATATASVTAQDAVRTLPDAYKLQFENAWVRIVRVHYGPNAKLPVHTHTQYGAAYVYLNNAGPVIFRHGGETTGAITRPATRAGTFRLYRAIEELHAVENTTAAPSDFLRVEFKTEPLEESALRGRFHRDATPETHSERVQFENAQVRISRILVGPGRTLEVKAAAEPALLIALTNTSFGTIGKERWLEPGSSLKLENAGTESSEALRFDLKTRPVK
jgi:hypothetical protein